MDLCRGWQVVFALHAHLVFVPRYKRRIFDAKALETLRVVFHSMCSDFEAQLVEFNGASDYVHLLLHYPPKLAVSRLVNSLKGLSARRLRQQRPDIARQYWWGGIWSASYFAASVGGAPIAILRKYIEQRRAPE